jgi:sialic acid synthase SpsE
LASFVIAEIGVNWDGDFDLVKEMIENAKKAECNAVKFQAFNEEIIKKHPQSSCLIKSSITKFNVKKIDEIAKSVGIEWFCTPMYSDAIDFLEPYVKRYKIRWFDGKKIVNNENSDIIKKALETKKEVIISSEISPKNSQYYDNPNVKWLYCVPKYPCSLEDFDFSKLNEFDGFSNHCPHFLAPLTASMLGAKIIEIHITSDKTKEFFDNNVSFDYNELSELMKMIRKSEKIKK